MGLLERAKKIRETESPLEKAAVGLRARAEAFRKEAGASTSVPLSSSGIEIRGLRARAEAFRTEEAQKTAPPKRADTTQAAGPATPESRKASPKKPEAKQEEKTSSPPSSQSSQIEDLLAGEGGDAAPLEDDILESILPPAQENLDAAKGLAASEIPDSMETGVSGISAESFGSLEEQEEKSGLLARAEALRKEEEHREEEEGLLGIDDAASLMESEEGPALPDLDAPLSEESDLPATAEESDENLLGVEDAEVLESEGELAAKTADSLELGQEEDLLKEGLDASERPSEKEKSEDEELLSIEDADGLEKLPDFTYEESPPEKDPALEERAERSRAHDPFASWEEEARSEAEREVKALSPASLESEEAQDDFLFDEDADYSTAPLEAHIAGQKKIDHYLALFDISKEISAIQDFEDLWDNLLYAVMGEVGAESICIFSTTQKLRSTSVFVPVAYSGIPEPEGWSLGPREAIYERLKESEGIVYADELLSSASGLSEQERRMLNESGAELLVPLKNMERFYGLIFLGPQVDGYEYNTDDMEFLKLLGEIASVGIDRVLTRRQFEEDTRELRRRNEVQARMFQLARQASLQKSLDDLYDVIATHLREDFDVSSFSIVLLSPKERCYRIFAGNRISPESMEKFRLTTDSDLVARVANLIRVYELSDFRENAEIKANYTNDDIALMSHYWIVPLINLNWLVGYIAIHETARPWTALDRELIISVAEVSSAIFANSIILSERENLFRDPFSPLEERLNKELEAAQEFRSSVSLVDIRVKNLRRLIDANPPEDISEFFRSLGKAISSFLTERDFLARVGQGNFALILPGRNRQEAALFAKKLKNELRRMRLMPRSPIDVSYVSNLISAPADTEDAARMLAILE